MLTLLDLNFPLWSGASKFLRIYSPVFLRVQKLLRICRMLRALWKCMTARLRHSVALSAHTNHHDTIGISDILQRPDLFPFFQKQIIEKSTPLVRPQGHYSKGDCLKHEQSIVSANRWRRSLPLIWKRGLSAASARASEKKKQKFQAPCSPKLQSVLFSSSQRPN